MLKLLQVATVSFLLSAACTASAQAQTAPAIEDAAWLAGRWIGEGLGGALEETWAPPAGGQMVGHFRLTVDGAPRFYEIMLMDVVEGGLRLRVKHFNPDFVGWEERDVWHTFEPVAASAEALTFDGLAIRRRGTDEIEIALVFRDENGLQEETLRLRRAPL